MTLADAKKHLDAWLEAELKVCQGQSYQIGSRKMERANLGEIREQIKFWEKRVARLQQGGSYRRRVARIVPIDY